jgi:hypothetical protein
MDNFNKTINLLEDVTTLDPPPEFQNNLKPFYSPDKIKKLYKKIILTVSNNVNKSREETNSFLFKKGMMLSDLYLKFYDNKPPIDPEMVVPEALKSIFKHALNLIKK